MIRRKSKPGEHAQWGKARCLGTRQHRAQGGPLVSSWRLEVRRIWKPSCGPACRQVDLLMLEASLGWGGVGSMMAGPRGAKVGLAEQSPRLPSTGWMMPVSRPEPGWGEGSRWRERRESGCEVRPPGRGTIQPGRPLLSQRLVPTSSKSWRDAS